MADAFSSTLANAALNLLTTTTAQTGYSTVYIALHTTGGPGSSGTSNPSAVTTRSAATFASATNSAGTSSISLTGTPPQWTGSASSETITDVSVWSTVGPSGGVFLFSAPLSASKTWSTSDTLQLSSLSISIPTAS